MSRETQNAANNTNQTAGARKREAQVNRARSLQSLIAYCENVSGCRHKLIAEYFGDTTLPKCEWACDWHKNPHLLAKKKDKQLASEEWCATQRQTGGYGYDEYD